MEANSHNVKKAINFLENQHGGGGTELLPALNRALALKGTENYSRTFIIATDGYVSVEKEAYDLIRRNLGEANFFTFGIGSSVNRYIIEGMAHVGKGLPFIATGKQDAESVAAKFRKYISNPVLTNIQIEFNEFDVYDVETLDIPDVFSERPVLVYGKYQGPVIGSIELSGKSGQKNYYRKLEIKKYTHQRTNPALKYLWARERVRLLDDYTNLAQNESHADEITSLGLKYNLLTAYTSFIAIDSEVRNQDGDITTIKQPLPLPQGVSNYAIGSSAKGQRGAFSKTRFNNNLINVDGIALESVVVDNEEEAETTIFVCVENYPEFKGGEKAFKAFLKKNLVYPKEAAENGIEGKVFVEFIVNEDGSIESLRIVRGVNSKLDQEALRVIKLTSGKWKPGIQNGKAVKVSMVVPVKFVL